MKSPRWSRKSRSKNQSGRKRFKKDEVLRAKTRQDDLERDDKLAREEENLAREKDNLAREKDNLAREKDNLAREKENLAREKENLARGIKPTREKKVPQDISTGTTPVRVATASQGFTSAYTQSAQHERNLGIITKSESSVADVKPGSREQCASKQPDVNRTDADDKDLREKHKNT